MIGVVATAVVGARSRSIESLIGGLGVYRIGSTAILDTRSTAGPPAACTGLGGKELDLGTLVTSQFGSSGGSETRRDKRVEIGVETKHQSYSLEVKRLVDS